MWLAATAALQATVEHYSGWMPSPAVIDGLKGEGRWNNDWDASLELLRRHGADLPERQALVEIFSGFYFGGDPDGDPSSWQGFIRDEPLLVSADFFGAIDQLGWTLGLRQRRRAALGPIRAGAATAAGGTAPDRHG